MISVHKHTTADIPAEIAEAIGGQSLLASTPFSNVWETLGGRIVYWVAEENGSIAAVLTGAEFGCVPFLRFQAMTDGLPSTLYFANDNCDKAHLASQLLDGVSQQSYIKSFVTDFDNSLPPHSTFQRRQLCTHIGDITNPAYEPSDKTLMSEIRKAERDKTSIEQFEWSKHGSRFIDLVTLSETRHGRLPKYPARFFEQLAIVSENDNRIIWTWCEHDGTPVASHIYFIFGSQAVNWQIYYDKEFSALKANQLTTWTAIANLRGRGVAHLNLGASPDTAEGLVAYKSKWNAVEYPYSILEKKTWLGKLW
jgi:Acetyltransferase (GNAT) domain